VAKKDGNLYIVYNLIPLNAITIYDSQEPPLVYLYTEQCSARSIYSGLDLFVGYNHHILAEESRDYTTFDTPLGTMCLIVLSQGWTGSVNNDVAFILLQTSFSHISINSLTILIVLMATESPQKTFQSMSVMS